MSEDVPRVTTATVIRHPLSQNCVGCDEGEPLTCGDEPVIYICHEDEHPDTCGRIPPKETPEPKGNYIGRHDPI